MMMAEEPFVWMLRRPTGAYVPFRPEDSIKLESARLANSAGEVEVDCGRRVVDLGRRRLRSVYWASEPCEVRRCVWFWERQRNELMPYTEDDCVLLERMHRSGKKNEPVVLGDGTHAVTFHEPTEAEGASHLNKPRVGPWQHRVDDGWGRSVRRVLRGLPGARPLPVSSGDAAPLVHLCLVVHGIGESLFLKEPLHASENGVAAGVGGTYDEGLTHHIGSTDQLRARADELLAAEGAGRVEFLPVLWAQSVRPPRVLENVERCTLGSVRRLRSLANDVVLDGMFYMSSGSRAVIVRTVVEEINRLAALFLERNPGFAERGGKISLLGHSLGSVILFDVCRHMSAAGTAAAADAAAAAADAAAAAALPPRFRRHSSVAQQFSSLPLRLDFAPHTLFLVGSPLGVFECVRSSHSGEAQYVGDHEHEHQHGASSSGIDHEHGSGAPLGERFRLRCCARVLNVFSKHDPVAYRIEPLLLPELAEHAPAYVPLVGGGTRLHLQMRERISRMNALSADILDSARCQGYKLTSWLKGSGDSPEREARSSTAKAEAAVSSPPASCGKEALLRRTRLNRGEAVDWQLQESAVSATTSVAEYAAAVGAHNGYWRSAEFANFLLQRMAEEEEGDEGGSGEREGGGRGGSSAGGAQGEGAG